MPKIYECQRAKSDIIQLHVLNDSLVAYTTKLHGIKIFDFNECEIKKNILNTHLNSEVTICAFSPNSELFAFVNNQLIYIIDIDFKKVIHSIELNGEEIEIICFDSSSSYIIAGSKNGRVLQYKTNSSSLLSRLCSFPHDTSGMDIKNRENKNFVSSFAFYKNLFACSGYGGAIFVIDLNSNTNKNIITHNKTRIDALCFLNEETIACGKNNGVVDIISLNENNTYKSIHTPILEIKQIIVMPNPNYIMISGKSNIITVIDVKNHKIAHSKYIEFETQIKQIGIAKNDLLIVALNNNKIVEVELLGIEKLKSLLADNLIKEAFELISKEPMLQSSFEHKMLEDDFNRGYDKATEALVNENRALALEILEPYKDIKSKQSSVKNLFDAFKNYPRLKILFLERKYAIAYSMCSKFEPLKHTPQYKKMEQTFKLAFFNAQKHILQNNLDGAKIILNEYNTITSKKPLIKLLLTQNKQFVELLKAIHNKDFKTVDKLTNANELFKQIPNYVALNNQVEETLLEIEAEIKDANISRAKELLDSINEIPSIYHRVEQLYLKCRHVVLLRKAYEESDFITCYEILDSHKYLSSTELGALLEKHWSKLMQKCEAFALEGNIKDIKLTLGTLIGLSTRHNKIGDLIRVSFHVRIKKLMDTKSFRGAEAIIYTYIDIFGRDSEINHIMKVFEDISGLKLAITQIQLQRPTRDSWRESDIIMKNP